MQRQETWNKLNFSVVVTCLNSVTSMIDVHMGGDLSWQRVVITRKVVQVQICKESLLSPIKMKWRSCPLITKFWRREWELFQRNCAKIRKPSRKQVRFWSRKTISFRFFNRMFWNWTSICSRWHAKVEFCLMVPETHHRMSSPFN